MHRACCVLGRLLHQRRGQVAPLITIVLASAALAQDGPTTANPRDFGLDLAPGIVAPGENQAVTTTDDDSLPVVGRIHVRVGAGAIVLLPNGELVARREGQFAPTDRKF